MFAPAVKRAFILSSTRSFVKYRFVPSVRPLVLLGISESRAIELGILASGIVPDGLFARAHVAIRSSARVLVK